MKIKFGRIGLYGCFRLLYELFGMVAWSFSNWIYRHYQVIDYQRVNTVSPWNISCSNVAKSHVTILLNHIWFVYVYKPLFYLHFILSIIYENKLFFKRTLYN
jgi:hypothetical protein